MEDKFSNRLNDHDQVLRDFLTSEIGTGIRIPKGFNLVVKATERKILLAGDPDAAGLLHPFHPTINVGNWVVENPPWWIPAIADTLDLPVLVKRQYGGIQLPKLPRLPVPAGERIVTRVQIGANGFSIDPQEALISDGAFEFRVAGENIHWVLPILNASVSRLYLLSKATSRFGFSMTNPGALSDLPIPRLTAEERDLLARLTACRIAAASLKPRTADRSMMLRYFEQILNALVYETIFRGEMWEGLGMSFFDALAEENVPEIGTNDTDGLKPLFRRLFNRNHPVRTGVFFLNSIKSIREIEETIRGLDDGRQYSRSKGAA